MENGEDGNWIRNSTIRALSLAAISFFQSVSIVYHSFVELKKDVDNLQNSRKSVYKRMREWKNNGYNKKKKRARKQPLYKKIDLPSSF